MGIETELPEGERLIVEKVWQPGVVFTERELKLIWNSETYVHNDPAGLPGHNLMVIIDKFDQLVGMMAGRLTSEELDECVAIFEDDEQPELVFPGKCEADQGLTELTPDEWTVLNTLADAWNCFVHLPVIHSRDRSEFMQAIHQAQNTVLARVAMRQIR